MSRNATEVTPMAKAAPPTLGQPGPDDAPENQFFNGCGDDDPTIFGQRRGRQLAGAQRTPSSVISLNIAGGSARRGHGPP
ncbi:hypothetical protein N7E70_024510 [Aminobacter sp. NyZ550]|jgi:hypothetical protein|uniref:hypothetical protein n=1 Tax=unclassified Aminobacter TaxID=2644704 RepID=UPI0012AFEA2D|nr:MULTISPECIES: hypothetical protein [unclassified Aminobacter]MRX36356.1 hypothetical protein [Aminobacter sp. MDW-2]QNH33816.1 hypothetical protein H5P29_25540 [Aminobacter sp. MDW-2]WAX94787.1 hypothetical protein N7E70_024510 [Aminobacter sp. NyZ550]